jgi:hypothetical protein
VTVRELCARFPEIPQDLRDDPVLVRFADALDGLLRMARCPSPCATEHDAANHYYLKLVGPLSIYGYGLATRERTLAEIAEIVKRYEADPQGFAKTLVPPGAGEREVRGPGCDDP